MATVRDRCPCSCIAHYLPHTALICTSSVCLYRSSRLFLILTCRPVQPVGLEHIVFSQVAAGSDHCLALTTSGHVYTFGNGQQGQLGRKIIERSKKHHTCQSDAAEMTLQERWKHSRPAVYCWPDYQIQERGLTPERLALKNIVLVACGAYHSFAVEKNGTVYAWGFNS